MTDKQDTLDAVLALPGSVQDAIDMLNDYTELFEGDEELHELLSELHDYLAHISSMSNRVRQLVARKKS